MAKRCRTPSNGVAYYFDGGRGNDKFTGDSAGDTAYGREAEDTLHGWSGDDFLYPASHFRAV